MPKYKFYLLWHYFILIYFYFSLFQSLPSTILAVNIELAVLPTTFITVAGASITTAILSLLKSKVIPSNISMSAEISLKGDVSKIGEVKEKITAGGSYFLDF